MSTEAEHNEHAWFQERIEAALAGGLETAERVRFDAHAAECPACAAELAAARQTEEQMSAWFALPAAGLEDRLIARLRDAGGRSPRRRNWNIGAPLRAVGLVHPAVRRAVTGVAAGLMLAGFGYVVTNAVESGTMPSPLATASPRPRAAGTAAASSQPAAMWRWGRAGDADGDRVGEGLAIRSENTFGGGVTIEKESRSKLPESLALKDPSGDVQRKNLGDIEGAQTHFYAAPGLGVTNGTNGGVVDLKAGVADGPEQGNISARYFDGMNDSDKLGKALNRGTVVSGGTVVIDGWNKDAPNAGGSQAGGQGSAQNGRGGRGGGVGGGGGGGGGETSGARALDRFDAKPGPTAGTNGPVPAQDFAFKPTEFGTTLGVKAAGPQAAVEDQSGATPGQPRIAKRGRQRELSEQELSRAPESEGRTGNVDFSLTDAPPPPAPAAAPVAPSAPANAPANAPAPANPPAAATTRKVIRNGQMEFEVDRFDSAFAQVSKLTQESGGYVGTTDSEKLPNGKVKGTITVRVPPDRLDTLVLQLRGIGELKSQKLEAQDVTKAYTDLDSQLRAARAMEERLIAIIKEGKGQIKDLLAAEKELGVWREKVERLVGEMRYYDSLVSLSTLNVTLLEKDIRTAASATETETIDAGIETQDVEKSRAEALKAIEEAKGRVIQSDLKRYDAGQFGATIVAEVPPDASGPLLDRIRQIGKVARLDVQRKQTSDANATSTATHAPLKVEKRDTRLNLSLYNLANVAARQTSQINLATPDVEAAYRAVLERVSKAGGRIVTSNLNRNRPEQTTGTISFEVPSPEADAVTNDLRALGEMMKLAVTENPDVQNVTTAKRAFSVQLLAAAGIAPRETATLHVASADVARAREAILAAAGEGGARVLTSQLNEKDRSNPSASLEVDVPRAALPAVEKALAEAGDTVSRIVSRSNDTENTSDTKVKLQLNLTPAEKLPPREVTSLGIELRDVEGATASLQQAAQDAGGRVVEQNLTRDRDGNASGKFVADVPLAKAQQVIDQAKQLGSVRAVQSSRNQQVPAGNLARARVEVSFGSADTLVEPGRGLWATIRNGLATSVSGLLWSLQLIIIGLCFVLPWALVLWAGWRWMKRRGGAQSADVPATTTPAT